jgi:hydroxypyruvate isomerase
METNFTKSLKMRPQFNLKYAPHIGSFTHSAGKDPIDQINYMADLGFKAFEDSGFVSPLVSFNSTRMGIGMCSQTPEMLTKIGETLAKRGMEMGTFVITPTKWPPIELVTSGKPEYREEFLNKCKSGVEVAKRLNAKFVTITLDCFDRSLPIEMQTANAIDALRKACDIFEPIGVTMAIETLADHHELFLRTSTQAYMICKAVNRDACKILFDMYHLQKNEGRLIYHIDMVWDEIGYFQIGDEPGRCEPGTGEINYKNIFKHIYQKSKADNKDFILGMEHFNSIDGIEGEKALLEAYKQADNFQK